MTFKEKEELCLMLDNLMGEFDQYTDIMFIRRYKDGTVGVLRNDDNINNKICMLEKAKDFVMEDV